MDLAAIGTENCLCSTAYAEGTDFIAHITNLHTKWQEATEKGATISDATFRTIIMNSLPESWNTIIASLYATTTSAVLIPSSPLGMSENAKAKH